MNRDQDPIWRQCLSVVEPILDSLGFTAEADNRFNEARFARILFNSLAA
jgi:hypothetical protein